ncbi:MAG: cytochrome c oxidase subunit II [Deltaproteobacteria bacterium]|nr:cytochrome c oxidase subunit II [Deltaproteobacteria bacterium]
MTDWLGDPSGPGARWTASLAWVIFLVFLAVIAAVWALLGYLMLRGRRGSFAEHLPWNEGGGKGWVIAFGLVAPAVVFLGCFIGSLVVMDAVPIEGAHHHDMAMKPEITVTGHQWWWEVRYNGPDVFTTANEIHIPAGRPVTIELKSNDVIHSFWIPELHGKVDLIPGRDNTITIEADVPGRYEGQCAEYCGEQHALMRMAVVAQDDAAYKAWRYKESQPAILPQSEPAITGLEVFEMKSCSTCHTIRGTRALATVGPDLTHVAGRAQLAANAIPNSHAYLAAWIVRAQTLKPDSEMPNLDQLTGDELTALVAFLRTLQ